MKKQSANNAIFEFEKLRFEINYTASQILINYNDLNNIKNNFNEMKLKMLEWETRANEILIKDCA